MADTISPDSTIAASVAAAAGGTAPNPATAGGVDTTGTPMTQVAAQAQPDPSNLTYLEQLQKAGL